MRRFKVIWILILVSFVFTAQAQLDTDIFPNQGKPTYSFEHPLTQKADSLLKARQYKQAIPLFEQARSEFLKNENWEALVYTLQKLGDTFWRIRLDQKAIDHFTKAKKNADKHLEANHFLIANNYLKLALIAHFNWKFTNATANLDTALVLYKKSNYHDSSFYENIVNFKHYSYFFSNTNLDTCIKYLGVRAKIINSRHASTKEQTTLMGDYAQTYEKMGNLEMSVIYSREALRIATSDSTSSITLISDHKYVLATAYYEIKDFESSLNLALEMLKKAKDSFETFDLRFAEYYNLIGVNHMYLDNSNLAKLYFEKSIQILDSNHYREYPYWSYLVNQGILKYRNNNFEQAEQKALETVKGLKKLLHPRDIRLAQPYLLLGDIYRSTDKNPLASKYYDSALICSIRNYDPSDGKKIIQSAEFNPYFQDAVTGKIILSNKSHTSDLDDYEQLISLSDLLYRSYKIKNFYEVDSKLRYANQFKTLYWLFLEKALKQPGLNKFDLILKSMERSRSSALIQQMGDYSLTINNSIPDDLRIHYARAKFKIDSLDAEIYNLSQNSVMSDSVLVVNLERMEWNKKLSEVKATIEQDFGDQIRKDLESEVTLASIRADHQLSENRAFIEFFVGDSSIFVLGATNTKTSFHKVDRDSSFDQTVSGFLKEVNNKPETAQLNQHLIEFEKYAGMLYQKLMAPVLADLGDQVRSLIIVPDEELYKIPFELLVKGSSQKASSFNELNFLLKDYQITHALNARASNIKRPEPTRGTLGFGYAGEGVVDERAELGGLPGALKEIDYLKKNFRGDYYIGESGTKQQFLEKAGEYEVLHLALHGKADSTSRFNSSLIFNGDQDYLLTATDLYKVRLKSKLVVLSACETGLGKINKGEGVFSIARGFSAAGIPSLVTTLWKVNDQAGAQITQAFYENLKTGASKDAALQKAKLDYLASADNLSSSPYYWGNFILLGDSSPINITQKKNPTLTYLAILLLMAMAILVAKRKKTRAN